MADIEELERYYISNASLKGTSDEANALRQWNNIVRDMTRSLESATNSIIKVTTKINEKGNALSTFDVPKGMSNVASSVFANQLGLIPSKYGLKGDFTNMLNTQDEYRRLYFSKDIHGSRAQRELKDLSDKLGLTVQSTPTKAHKDRYTIGMPVSEGDWNRALARFGDDEAKARRSLAGKLFRTDLASVERYSRNVADERKEKEQAEERKKEEKEQKDNSRKSLSTLTKVGVILTAIADITRRILTATLDRATEVRKDNITAKNLGITYDNMRQYKTFETTMGMERGTFTSAISSLQSSFGDITHLDEKALSELAKVMGGGVINAINSGLGKNNPEKLMEQILNTYYERGQRGINSIGQRVGKYQAERELATALEKAGLKEIAEILRNMFYVNDTGIYKGSVPTGDSAFKEYMSLVTAYTMDNTKVDYKVAEELGTVIGDLKARFDDLKKNLETGLLVALSRVINKLNNWDIGKSPVEKMADRRKRVESNEELLKLSAEQMLMSKTQANALFAKSGIKWGSLASKYGVKGDWTDFVEWIASQDYTKIKDKELLDFVHTFRSFLRTPEGEKAYEQYAYYEQAKQNKEYAEAQLESARKGKKVEFDPTRFSPAGFQLSASAIAEGVLDPAIALYGMSTYTNPAWALRYNTFTADKIYADWKKNINAGQDITWNQAKNLSNADALLEAIAYKVGVATKGKKKRTWLAELEEKYAQGYLTDDIVKQALLSTIVSPNGMLNQNVGIPTGDLIDLAMYTGKTGFQDAMGALNVINTNAKVISELLAESKAKAKQDVSVTASNYNEKERTMTLNVKFTDIQGKQLQKAIRVEVDEAFNNKDISYEAVIPSEAIIQSSAD